MRSILTLVKGIMRFFFWFKAGGQHLQQKESGVPVIVRPFSKRFFTFFKNGHDMVFLLQFACFRRNLTPRSDLYSLQHCSVEERNGHARFHDH